MASGQLSPFLVTHFNNGVALNTDQECGKIDTLPHRSEVGAISIQRENNHCVPLLTQKSLSQLFKWL